MACDGRNIIPLVRGPDGRPVKMAEKMADLPPANLKRWVPQRKAEVVAAVRNGVITIDGACERYDLSVEEFLSWEQAIEDYGVEGLRINHIQNHRHH